jgi:hypothetical protein
VDPLRIIPPIRPRIEEQKTAHELKRRNTLPTNPDKSGLARIDCRWIAPKYTLGAIHRQGINRCESSVQSGSSTIPVHSFMQGKRLNRWKGLTDTDSPNILGCNPCRATSPRRSRWPVPGTTFVKIRVNSWANLFLFSV